MKKSFIVHIDSLNVLDDLTDDQCGELLRAFKAYHSGEQIELSPLVKIAFSPFKNQFQRDLEKYNNICERNRLNGLKGGRPKEPTGLSGNPKEPKKADNDSDSKNDSDNDKESKRFKPPSLLEVQQYISEKQFNIDADQFIDFYSAKGWMIGKNKMKDWKAACRTWSKRGQNETNKPRRNPTAIERVETACRKQESIDNEQDNLPALGTDDQNIWS